MVLGKDIRLNRILTNGRMICVPMDHGISNGPLDGIRNIGKFMLDNEYSGLSCVLVNKGIIKSLPKPLDIGIIAHMSASTSLGPDPNKKVLMGSVKEAIRLGADAVSLHINIGSKEEPMMLHKLGMVADECNEWSMPLIAMMYPRGENINNPLDPVVVSHAARIGAEAGADIVKTVYTGDSDSFRDVVKSCPVPVVIAGGPKSKTDANILEMCSGAIDAGAIGVTFGRNIFQHPNPGKIIKSLFEIIVKNKRLEEVISNYRKKQEQ
ncbi:MAG: 2-amino-3,7-dideoxy-D-threo-hept-6-ulosonate synthase [Thermoproteota archaeon]|nr:2-amino-3,7-dideoxy-D-threo-hept-6-ulosonate synthase [Thermoproteota archaeon]